MEIANTTASFSWSDAMYLKIIKETSETRASLDCYDIDYFLNIYEGLMLSDYLDALAKKDMVMKQEAIELANKQKKGKKKGGG